MMKRALLAAAAAIALAAPAAADQKFPARLVGFAAIPAMSMIAPPADAPQGFWISGKFTGAGNLRNDRPMSVPGDTGALHGRRPTGISLPFLGQPLQGFSGFSAARGPDGSVIALIDNGFGNKRNSPDALLFFVRIAPDWANQRIDVRQTVFLRDPDRVVPFRIVNEDTRERYLTGGDFDPESIQLVGDSIWIGEEFGPYILRATLDGRITGIFETRVGEEVLRSPDHPANVIPASPTQAVSFRVPRSGGFEGMAASPDGRFLYAMLEKPLFAAGTANAETHNGRQFLRVLEFDTQAARWTGREFRYPLEQGATAIGDFNMIDERRALVIERDDGEGDPSLACPTGQPARPDCFPLPARFKRVVLIDLMADEGGFVKKLGHIDLMDISDPENVAKVKGDAARDLNGKYTFPFFTIENVVRVDANTIMVAVDNNLPFSSGRFLNRAADNEFILLDVRELLAAR
jgi:hypothetical protein